ncbi:MAG: enoyl-CoA hydratase/isomerase family protein [Candidatus Krumholzibacteria bacterium]|nr:enoyl-CoA hydratase/isomerase family protein [Candidatus Krumholzibacteria bacterium]MDH4337575.1 enoyl-CoA hydratase/isomerase family protein [Candidatus Krumholzibacteria bacterium]MDH5271370.1 enoyl-CoA hydratase/isomerase family protein [Candidatus Krumholzibacteria bacterium]MDH5628328.1 enoyl-CoA hydratase/isomerase family protein [Candidatus Krumholzibacteria bacterium]
MTHYTTFQIKRDGPVAHVVLSRPEVKNAFDDVLIKEMSGALEAIAHDDSIRVMVLTGDGNVFSAGADLNWMKKVAGYGFEENVEDALIFARMLESLYRLPKPTIARINGACIGGGVGLVSACDVAVSVPDAKFALREILLGIAPSAISPYVLRKIGERYAHDYFLTGRTFDANRAREIGLVNEVVERELLDAEVDVWVKRFLHAGPKGIAATKKLINRVAWSSIEDVQEYTARTIASLRGSDEGREGFAAFFEKRKPDWDTEG